MEDKIKTYKIVTAICMLLIIIISVGAIIIYGNDKPIEEETINEDTKSFIEDYESYNNEDAYEDYKHLELDLDENVNIEIIDDEKILDVFNEDNAIIYFGFPDCPYCRVLIDPLLDAAVANDTKIYYMDITNIRNKYEYSDKNLTETVKGTDYYYEMLDIMDEFLSDYIVYDEDDNERNTNTKRIYAPTIVSIKNKAVIELTTGEYAEGFNPYEVESTEYDRLYDLFDDMLKSNKQEFCASDIGC